MNNIIKKAICILLAYSLSAGDASAVNVSTVNPNIPAANSPMSSAPVRNNFAAAANDINNLYTLLSSGDGPVPLPGPATLGGLFSIAPVAHNFVTGLGTNGILTYSQPSFTDISGSVSVSQGGTGASSAGGSLDNLTNFTGIGNIILNRTGAATWIAMAANLPLATYSMDDCAPGWESFGETAMGTAIQTCALTAQRIAISQGADRQGNIGRVGFVDFSINAKSPSLSTSIYIPRYVRMVAHGKFVRDGSAGTPSPDWNGDTTTKTLSNLWRPMFIFPPSGLQRSILEVSANSNGSDRGAGVFYGRAYRVKTLTITSGGSGFAGGETCSMANGDTYSPSASATFTVATALGGLATSLTYAPSRYATQTGQYYLPPLQQQQQWTVANGWNGLAPGSGGIFPNGTYPIVFASTGVYKATCSGTGVGLTVTPTWWADWETGDTTYDGDFGNTGGAATGSLEDIVVVQSGNAISSSYGKIRAFAASAFDLEVNRVQTQGASIGQEFLGSDIRVNIINDVGSAAQLKLRGGAAMHFNQAVLDTPNDTVNNDAHNLEIDNCDDCSINFLTMFHNSSSGATMNGNMLRLGADTSVSGGTTLNSGLKIHGKAFSDGAGGSNLTAMGCAFTQNSAIDIDISNIGKNNVARAQQIPTMVAYGTACAASNRFGGSIDNSTATIYTGSATNGGTLFWNSFLNAWLNPYLTTNYANNGAITFQLKANNSTDVNFLQIESNATNLSPTLQAAGTDTNIALALSSKATGSINLNTGNGGRQVRIFDTGSAVDYIQLTGGVTGTPGTVTASAQGTDTDVNFAVNPKGIGNLTTSNYFTWAGEGRVSTQFNAAATTTLANVTGLTSALQNGKTYAFRAVLHVSADATGGHKYAVNSTGTASSVIYEIRSTCNTTDADIISSRQSTLAGSAGQAGCTDPYTVIEGTVTTSSAGTLAVQFAQNAASGTSGVLVGSTLFVNIIN